MPQPLVPLPPRPRPSWSSLAASAVVHAAVIALAVTLSTREPPDQQGERELQSEPSRRVDMVYLPPPPPEPPPPAPPEPPRVTPPPQAAPPPAPPPPRPSAPPPEARQPEPEDRANAPPEAVRSEGEETDEPEGESDPAAPAEAPRVEAPAVEAPTMESEARRIFGRRRVATRPGAGPRAVRPLETYIPDRPDKCVPSPRTPSDSSAPVQYGTVVGRIFQQDGGKPLAGAHLQMLGTPYVAFTDSDGEYRFHFDMSLVDNCRTQYVRVTARGYESRLLVLMVGTNVRSEDVHLERRSRWPGL